MNDALPTLYERGLLTDLDLHFAGLMIRLDNNSECSDDAVLPEEERLGKKSLLALAAALASHATGQGDVCIHLRQWVRRAQWIATTAEVPIAAPPIGEWLNALRASPVVGRPLNQWRPLILDQRGRLYLYRYWEYEQRLADDLLQRAQAASQTVDKGRLRPALNLLYPRNDKLIGPDWQKVAAVVATLKRLCVISGGPGTGKTSTVLRILALLASQAGAHPLRMALAAPTGKAAARLQEAIRAAKPDLGRLGLESEYLAQIPEEASTLHRLLGARSNSANFRYHRDNPLPLDVLVVDEVSMVGLALMAKVVAALPSTARLILLGDKDQLASVEAGAALGDICAGSGHFSPEFREQLTVLTGETLPSGKPTLSPLTDAIVLLKHSYRFDATSGIGALARAVNRGKALEALTLLEGTPHSDIAWQALTEPAELPEQLADPVCVGFAPYLQSVRERASPAVVFERFNQFRVLCALRSGPFGVEALNRLCEDALHNQGLVNARPVWYPGRPVMIVCNDYNLRLFNGDIGVALPDLEDDDRIKVFFLGSDGALRSFAPSRLPEHETVYAMTVHKSQGSEFDHVLVMMPNVISPVLSRQLLYTALTRAKRQASFYGAPEVFTDAVERRLRRSSGLRDRLWAEPRRTSYGRSPA